MQQNIEEALALISTYLSITYFVYDGALGHSAATNMVHQKGLHLISKLRHDSSLYFPYNGEYSKRGRPRKYGDKVIYNQLDDEYLKKTKKEKESQVDYYQLKVWHKKFTNLLNVVIIVHTNLKTGKQSKTILFSSDLTLAYDKLVQFYCLRFKIEFNFRDAKQYWGLEDFMNIKKISVSNAANFALFMVTFSQLLLPKIPNLNNGSMLDLKTFFRAYKYVHRIIKSLGLNTEEFLINEKHIQAAEIGRIHAYSG